MKSFRQYLTEARSTKPRKTFVRAVRGHVLKKFGLIGGAIEAAMRKRDVARDKKRTP